MAADFCMACDAVIPVDTFTETPEGYLKLDDERWMSTVNLTDDVLFICGDDFPFHRINSDFNGRVNWCNIDCFGRWLSKKVWG